MRQAQQQIAFRAFEYQQGGDFARADYRFVPRPGTGWVIERNGARHLELGSGYRVLATRCCGVCSTDLDRHRLPFPLPQITGHELVAEDELGRRYVVEINASHAARGLTASERSDAGPCPFCLAGLSRHCPERIVLGIHDLPGGFGSHVLVPEAAVLPLSDAIEDEVAVLVEPFAAALNAVDRIAPAAGDEIAVLGPRRLGMLVIAALAARRERSGIDHRILALSRDPELLDLARRLGADAGLQVEGDGANLRSALADVVIDTTANPRGLELALRLARREVHLKSTHGQPSAGIHHGTALVVDELAITRFEEDAARGPERVAALAARGRRRHRARVAWIASQAPPDWIGQVADVDRCREPAAALEEAGAWTDELPRHDVAVVERLDQIDTVVRPDARREVAAVRPGGEIHWWPPAGSAEEDARASELAAAVIGRGVRVSGSRCGDFRQALDLIESDRRLLALGRSLITHRFGAEELPRAFDVARSRECIKALVVHPR